VRLSAIDTLVERRTRYLILVHVPTDRPTAEAMREGITGALGQLPAPLRRTLTWDSGQGAGDASPGQRADRRPWCSSVTPTRRGNAARMKTLNALPRDYFPKGTDLCAITPEELTRVTDEIDERPRKTLAWARPADLLADQTAAETA